MQNAMRFAGESVMGLSLGFGCPAWQGICRAARAGVLPRSGQATARCRPVKAWCGQGLCKLHRRSRLGAGLDVGPVN